MMEEEERPKKIPKLDAQNGDEEFEIAMTGAVGAAPAHEAEDNASDKEPSAAIEQRSDSGDPAKATGDDKTGEGGRISKNQLKKIRRQERWDAGKADRKAKRKEKILEQRQKKRTEWEEAERSGTLDELRKARKATRKLPQRSTVLPVTFVLDCSFDDLMMDKERVSLSSQITRSYSDNNRAPYQGHLVVSSFDGHLKERFDTVLSSYENWKGVRFMSEDYLHAAEAAKEWMQEPRGGMVGSFADRSDAKPEDGEIVYLSSESPDTLTELKPYSTYVVGGLVDKNRHKGVCYKRAMEKGIKTAKLPIGNYIHMASRQVLTTNHVVEIMVRWLELGDWGKAFMNVIPQRKGGSLIEQEDEAEPEGEEQVEAPGQQAEGPPEPENV